MQGLDIKLKGVEDLKTTINCSTSAKIKSRINDINSEV